ncbi:MAG TPA: polyphosphate kinase 2 family protein [Candidatus Dormibacteraeota bacterium]
MADSHNQIRRAIRHFRVAPGSRVRLPRDFDPAYAGRAFQRGGAALLLERGVELLAEYQAKLAAQGTYGVLVVLQAMDAAGKDGTIKHVMSGINPQGVKVHGFKVPSAEELDHDFLWRYQRALPARGEIGIFNRSHYEEVLVVRVHRELLDRQKLPPQTTGRGVWGRRYRAINDWERHLVENGIRVVKLFLNESKKEQRRRFLARLDNPDKNWKFSSADIRERRYWDDYQRAYSDVLSNTSTGWAPWYVVPADHKWFARVLAALVILETVMDIGPNYPEVGGEARRLMAEATVELEAEGPRRSVEEDPVQAPLKPSRSQTASGPNRTAWW